MKETFKEVNFGTERLDLVSKCNEIIDRYPLVYPVDCLDQLVVAVAKINRMKTVARSA